MKKIYSTKKVTIFKDEVYLYSNHREQLIRRLKKATGFENLESWDCVEAGVFVHVLVKGYHILPERKWSKSVQIARRMKRLLYDN